MKTQVQPIRYLHCYYDGLSNSKLSIFLDASQREGVLQKNLDKKCSGRAQFRSKHAFKPNRPPGSIPRGDIGARQVGRCVLA